MPAPVSVDAALLLPMEREKLDAVIDLALDALKIVDGGNPADETGWRSDEYCEAYLILRDLPPAVHELIEALCEARAFIDGQIDVVDGSYGEPAPNRAMSLAQQIDAALTKAGVR